MRDLIELNLESPGPMLSEQAIENFQEHFTTTLPPDYLHFLRQSNGGDPNGTFDFNYLPDFEGGLEQGADNIGELFSLTSDQEDLGGVWANTQFLRDVFLTKGWGTNIVTVARNGADDMIYISTEGDSHPLYILYRGMDDMRRKVGESFEDFIDSLHVHDWGDEE